MMKKILVSRGYGAGWSTWHSGNKQKQIAEYEPIIKFIEEGGNPDDLDHNGASQKKDSKPHPLVAQMMKDLELGDHFYTGGASGLTVCTISGRYRIDEYDGYEAITTEDDFW